MASFATVKSDFVELLGKNADEKSSDIFATWYDVRGKQIKSYTYKQMWNEAGLIAYHLRHEWGIANGENGRQPRGTGARHKPHETMMGLIGGLTISAGLVEEETIRDDENDIGSVSVLDALSSVVPLVPQTTTPSNEQVFHTRRLYKNGEIYKGPFVDGMRHGEGAVCTREEGTKFCERYVSWHPCFVVLGFLRDVQYLHFSYFPRYPFFRFRSYLHNEQVINMVKMASNLEWSFAILLVYISLYHSLRA